MDTVLQTLLADMGDPTLSLEDLCCIDRRVQSFIQTSLAQTLSQDAEILEQVAYPLLSDSSSTTLTPLLSFGESVCQRYKKHLTQSTDYAPTELSSSMFRAAFSSLADADKHRKALLSRLHLVDTQNCLALPPLPHVRSTETFTLEYPEFGVTCFGDTGTTMIVPVVTDTGHEHCQSTAFTTFLKVIYDIRCSQPVTKATFGTLVRNRQH
jgi:hypothetical protein